MNNSECLFDVLTITTTTTERRLIIDLKTMTGTHNSVEIINANLMWSKFCIADAFSKRKKSSILSDEIKSRNIDNSIAQ